MTSRISFISALLLASLLNGCNSVTIRNTRPCTVAGILEAGGFCAETLTGKTNDMSPGDMLDMIEARDERPDPSPSYTPVPAPHQCAGVDTDRPCLPAKAPGVIQTVEDYGATKETLEEACRALGDSCTYEMKQTIKHMRFILFRAQLHLSAYQFWNRFKRGQTE